MPSFVWLQGASMPLVRRREAENQIRRAAAMHSGGWGGQSERQSGREAEGPRSQRGREAENEDDKEAENEAKQNA